MMKRTNRLNVTKPTTLAHTGASVPTMIWQPSAPTIITRRNFMNRLAAVGAVGMLAGLGKIDAIAQEVTAGAASRAPINPNSSLKISKVETFIHTNSWVFVKITTDGGQAMRRAIVVR